MSEWSNFFVATAGAAATLTGLTFVGVSINLTRILALRGLPERALISLVLLLTIFILSLLFLVPALSPRTPGWEVLCVALLAWVMVLRTDARIMRIRDVPYRKHIILNLILNQIAFLPYFISCISMLTQPPRTYPMINALSWLVAAFAFSFVKAVIDAWILLVEINR